MKLLFAAALLISPLSAFAANNLLFEGCLSNQMKDTMEIVKSTVGLRQLSQIEAAGELAVLVCKEKHSRLGVPVSDADVNSPTASEAILDGLFRVYPELKEKIKQNN